MEMNEVSASNQRDVGKKKISSSSLYSSRPKKIRKKYRKRITKR